MQGLYLPRLANEEPQLQRFWAWIRAEDNVRGLTLLSNVLQTIVLAVGLAIAIVTLRVNGETLRVNGETLEESNRIAWRSFLDTKSADLARELLNHDALHCVYHYEVSKVDAECEDTAYISKNLPIMIEYVTQWLLHLREVKMYSEHYNDKDYFNIWYKQEGEYLSDDPTGVVSFVLWKYFDCEKEANLKSSHKNCNFGSGSA